MRSLRFLPLTLLAGSHGFALAAPYLLACVALDAVLRSRKRPGVFGVVASAFGSRTLPNAAGAAIH